MNIAMIKPKTTTVSSVPIIIPKRDTVSTWNQIYASLRGANISVIPLNNLNSTVGNLTMYCVANIMANMVIPTAAIDSGNFFLVSMPNPEPTNVANSTKLAKYEKIRISVPTNRITSNSRNKIRKLTKLIRTQFLVTGR